MKKSKVASNAVVTDDLSIRHNAFVADLLVHGDQTRAYRSTFDCSGMHEKTVSSNASKLANDPKIVAAIASHKKAIVEKMMMSVAEVTKEYIDIVLADPSELTQVRHRCCRYCHGINHQYQWIDEAEWIAATLKAQEFNNTKKPTTPAKEMPSEAGGYGFDGNKRSDADCPRCLGDTNRYVWIADTRDLKGRAKRLFAGVKQTPNGIQVLMRDQDAALKNLASIMGLFIDRVQVGGPGDGPVVTQQLPNDAEEASKIYQAIVKARTQ